MEFELFKKQLIACIDNSDTEIAHVDADGILIEIALNASRGLLNEIQVTELIELYNQVNKWYA